MTNWNAFDIDELGSIVSDYHKSMYGWRPRFPGLYEDKIALVALAELIDEHIEQLKTTFAGREQLRANGWDIEETDPTLKQHARWLAEERAREEQEHEKIVDPFEI